jgi:hypothetical protein
VSREKPKAQETQSEEDIINPINLLLSQPEKVANLQELSKQSEKPVQDFIDKVDKKLGTESKANHKAADRIAEKANRPSIKKAKPWFDVEHVRDGFRFKTVLKDIKDLPKIAEMLKASGFGVVKIDTEKLLEPRDFGWRIVVIDLRMPNGQLVEYYLPVQELEDAKKNGNHEIFEKWRNRDFGNLTKDEIAEFYKDVEFSEDRYEKAWQDYLKRMGQTEKEIQECLEQMRKILEEE